MTVAAQRAGIPVEQVTDVAIDATVMLIATEERKFKLGVELDVELPSIADPAEAVELVDATHRLCPYSNAIRGNVDVAISVNGVELAGEADLTIARAA